MIRPFTRAAACGSLLALSACGGGSGGDGDSAEPFTLETKSGALRELSMAGSVLDGVPEVLDTAGATLAKSRSGSWGKVPVRQFGGARPKANCPLGGSRNEVSVESRSFVYFNLQNAAVTATREDDDACLYAAPSNEIPPGTTGVDRFNGRFEEGETAVVEGSKYGYVIDGTSNAAYFVTRTVSQNNREVYIEVDGSRGTIEQREPQGGGRDLRAVYRYSYNYDDSNESYFRLVELGQGTTPFTGQADANGGDIRFSGTYEYETSECDGGRVVVSTEEPINLSEGYPVDGRIRLTDSGGKFAVFTFSANGSATVSLNGGAPVSVSKTELENAIDDSGC